MLCKQNLNNTEILAVLTGGFQVGYFSHYQSLPFIYLFITPCLLFVEVQKEKNRHCTIFGTQFRENIYKKLFYTVRTI